MRDVLDCPEMECWRALFDDAVDPEERRHYERHLESCPSCQQRLDRANDCGEAMRTLVQRVGNPSALALESTLVPVLDRLRETKAPLSGPPAELPDLYFLQPAERPDLIGMLGTYEVQEVIGQGGMGVV